MRIETARFGVLEVPEESVVTFPEGLPGFTGKRYVIFRRDETPIVEWIQSLDEPDVALMTVDPQDLVPGYEGRPKAAELAPIAAAGTDPASLICRVVIRVADEPGRLYLNLFAPLFMNAERRLAMQVPLVGSGYGVRELWPPAEVPAPR